MNTVRLNAYAKLNLTLDITGVKGGYHLLDSLVTTVDLFDRIVIKKRKDALVHVSMHGMGSEIISPEENNAQSAAEAFVRRFGASGVDITIYKNIPLASGMGGSSADAAAVIAGMGRLFPVKNNADLKALADEFGSDTGYLLAGGLARIRGRGTEVEALPFVPMHFLVLCPREGVSTAACYRMFDESGCPSGTRTAEAVRHLPSVPCAAEHFGNDLYPAAKEINPAAERALAELRDFSPLAASMTGSGSAVFAVFETHELAEWAKSRYRGKARAYVVKSIDPNRMKMSRNPFVIAEGEGEE